MKDGGEEASVVELLWLACQEKQLREMAFGGGA